MHSKGATFQKWGLVILSSVVLFSAFSNKAFAQSATGTLTGTVTDPKGLAMANATITVHSEDTGVDMKPVMSNDTGSYVETLLPPGTYDVTASQTGFASVQHKGVTLEVGQTVRLDFAMPVQSQQSLVTVTTEIPVLETEKTEQTQNVSENMVANLPVSSRRWEQFVFLTPGVTPDGTTNGISFHGLNSLYNNNSVDGANNNSSYNGAARGGANDGYVYSGDSIREFQVSASNFNAELGQAAGGSVNAVTKSGTSAYHGDLFYNGRSPDFNAFDPVSKTTAALNGTAPSIPVRQQNQYGGSFGGPIIKDKLFFFVTVDDYDKVNPLFTTTQQVTPPIGQLVCPTLGAGDTIPNPAGGAPLSGGAAQAQMAVVCANAKSFAISNIVGTFPRSLAQEVQLLKFDYQVNQSNHLSIVGNLRDWKQPTSLLSVSGGTSYLQDRFAIATFSPTARVVAPASAMKLATKSATISPSLKAPTPSSSELT
jgi:Carboxypeptidase regulatory-like domain